jgi:hypothetical protein
MVPETPRAVAGATLIALIALRWFAVITQCKRATIGKPLSRPIGVSLDLNLEQLKRFARLTERAMAARIPANNRPLPSPFG